MANSPSGASTPRPWGSLRLPLPKTPPSKRRNLSQIGENVHRMTSSVSPKKRKNFSIPAPTITREGTVRVKTRRVNGPYDDPRQRPNEQEWPTPHNEPDAWSSNGVSGGAAQNTIHPEVAGSNDLIYSNSVPADDYQASINYQESQVSVTMADDTDSGAVQVASHYANAILEATMAAISEEDEAMQSQHPTYAESTSTIFPASENGDSSVTALRDDDSIIQSSVAEEQEVQEELESTQPNPFLEEPLAELSREEKCFGYLLPIFAEKETLTFDRSQPEVKIGRGRDCDWVIGTKHQRWISLHHCTISWNAREDGASEVRLYDHSHSGMFILRKGTIMRTQEGQYALLNDGDIISFVVRPDHAPHKPADDFRYKFYHTASRMQTERDGVHAKLSRAPTYHSLGLLR